MNYRLITAVCCLLPLMAARAGNLTETLPEGTLAVFEIQDIPALQDKWQQSPLGAAWKDFVAEKPLMTFMRAVSQQENFAADSEEPPLDEIEAFLAKAKERQAEITAHMTGSMVFAIGDFTSAMTVFKETEGKRQDLYTNMEDNGDVTEDQWEVLFKQEEELEALESAAVAKEFKVFIEVEDGEGLMTKIAGWTEEMIQEQESDEGDEIVFNTEDWQGVTLYKLESKEPEDALDKLLSPCWAVQNGVWTIAITREALIDSLTQLNEIPEASLADSRAYQDSLQAIGEQDAMFYINLPRLDPLIRKAMDPETMNQPVAPNRKSPAEYMDWFALDALTPYVLGMTLDQVGIHSAIRLGFTRETPLSRILIDPTEGPSPTPPFVHKDFAQVSTLNWNLGTAIRRLETELPGLDPQIPMMMAMGKGMVTAQLGMDMQLQVLDQLDSGLVIAQELDEEVLNEVMTATVKEDMAEMMRLQQEHPTSGQNRLIGFQLKDVQTVSGAMNTMLARIHPNGLPEPELYKDHPIYNPVPENAGEAAAGLIRFTYLDNYMLIAMGDPSLLHKAISASQDGSLRIWQQPEYQDARAPMPEGMAVDYMREEMLVALSKMMGIGFKSAFDGAADLPDMSKVVQTLGDSISVTTRQGTVFTSKSTLRFTEPE